MDPVRIIGSYLSPYVRKVLVFLDLKGLPYEIDPIWTLAYNILIKGTWTPRQCHEETVKMTNDAIVKYLTA